MRSSPSSVPTAPARRRPSRRWRATGSAAAAMSPCSGSIRPTPTAPGASGSASSCRNARCSPGSRFARRSSSTRGYYQRPRGVEETIDVVGLEEKADERAGKLSGGQQRRLDVALALIGDAELLFLDEPTTGFDPSARRQTWNAIANLKQLGKTIFLTTHYMDEAQFLADRVAIISGGEIVAEGAPDELGGRATAATAISFRLPDGFAAADIPVAAGERRPGAGPEIELVGRRPGAQSQRAHRMGAGAGHRAARAQGQPPEPRGRLSLADRGARRVNGPALAWHQFRYDQRIFWRNPASVFFTVMLPLALPADLRLDLRQRQDRGSRQPARPRPTTCRGS